jgi:hypothetical protein
MSKDRNINTKISDMKMLNLLLRRGGDYQIASFAVYFVIKYFLKRTVGQFIDAKSKASCLFVQ